jgi:hypothetical protein
MLLDRMGRRYGASVRTAAGLGCAVVAPWTTPPAGVAVTAVVAALFVGWSAVYLYQMLRRFRVWCVATDLAVVLALCLAQPWLASPTLLLGWSGWTLCVASFTVVVLQWHIRPALAWPAAVAVAGAYLLGAGASAGVSWLQVWPYAAWMLGEAGLGLLIWRLVHRGRRRAEVLLAEQLKQNRQAQIAAAQRTDQRAHWAAIHDTSATTLLMIGLGDVDGTEPWLPRQLQRDLQILYRTPESPPEGHVDVAAALETAVTDSTIEAAWECDGIVFVPASVADAFTGATAEALENVRRHAGVDRAWVRMDAAASRVHVEIADTGFGFDPSQIPPVRRGVRWSIDERMADVGGSARIESRPGAGTLVRLEWSFA